MAMERCLASLLKAVITVKTPYADYAGKNFTTVPGDWWPGSSASGKAEMYTLAVLAFKPDCSMVGCPAASPMRARLQGLSL